MTQKTIITVLSYNICLEAMTNNKDNTLNPNTHTAVPLGKKCVPVSPGSKLTVCAKNMADMINGLASSLKVNCLDFVGIQEASRWDELMKAADSSLNEMGFEHSKANNTELVSFYNKNRFDLVHSIKESFSTDPNRPYQILIFKEKNAEGGIVFINVHNPHSFPFTSMQTDFSNELKKLSNLTSEEKQYPIIAVGDFNETGWDWSSNSLSPKSWKPFSDAGIETEISIDNPPFSCCQSDGIWDDGNGGFRKGSRGGDYIFYSESPAKPQVPPNYDTSSLKSDHLPVVAVL